MPVPTYDKFIDPLLRFLARHPEGIPAPEAHEAAADALGIDDADRQLLVPSGVQRVYKNRASWAHDRLKRAGLSRSLRHGVWQLTDEGLRYASAHPAPLPSQEVRRLAEGFMDVRLSAAENEQSDDMPVPASVAVLGGPSSSDRLASPDDRLGDAVIEIRRTVAAEILQALASVSPTFFETIVLDVLHRMGYGATRADLQRVGGTGDGGIDGIISLDRLGLEKVYVQAKRWQSVVGRPDIQGFYGALAGQKANKGVFITTSGFTSQAVDFAKSVDRIVLVDGRKLAELMIDYEVGVSSRTIRVPKLDSDYFDEESA